MIRSMTAYGRGESCRLFGRLVVEITSLNRRHLELKVSLPDELASFEVDVRGWILPHLSRGGVTVRVKVSLAHEGPFASRLNTSLLSHYLSEGKRADEELQINPPPTFWLDWALRQEGVVVSRNREQDEDLLRLSLKEGVEAALCPFIEMKLKEGKTLRDDIEGRFSSILQEINQIEVLSDVVQAKNLNRLRQQIERIFEGDPLIEERLLKEATLLIEKGDFREELVRFRSHLSQAGELLEKKEADVGKALEFLLQEMVREINTLGVKAQDLEISKRVVGVKTELERVREQIQNVE